MFRRRNRLIEEIDAHVAAEADDNVARGMDPASARRAALRTFGNVGAARERVRERAPLYWLDTLWQDVRFACRLIARSRWTTLTVVATLTLGIALNVTVFNVLNALLLRPWIAHEPDTFVSVMPRFSGKYRREYSDYGSMSLPDYLRFRDSASSLQSLAAYRFMSFTLGGAEAGTVRGTLVSCNLFEVIRPGPAILGRYLAADECAVTRPAAVAILSENSWRTRFDADPLILGRTIHLNRVPFTIVGVAPAMTLSGPNAGPENHTDVWVPFSLLQTLRPSIAYFSDPAAQWLSVVGRRQPGVSLARVQEELGRLAREGDQLLPGRVMSITVTNGSLIQDPEMRERAPLLFGITLGVTSLLLVLACVNVTTLLLSRAAARQREVAVRLALGAGRGRLLRQFLTESLVLSGMAAAASLFIAQRAPAVLWQSIMSRPAPFSLSPDWRVLAFAAAVAAAAGIMAGVSPALESLRTDTAESLKGSSGAVTPGRRRRWVRSGLVSVQIAVSLLLVVQVGLFTRAQRRFFSYEPGFDTRRVVGVTLESVAAGFAPPSAFYDELDARVRALPGVSHAAYASLAPWTARNSTAIAEIDGTPVPPTNDYRRDPARRVVTADYFAVLNLQPLRGRVFTADEIARPGPLVPTVISEAMARQYWPGRDPIGRRFRISGVHEVIGVTPDVQSVASMQDDGPFYYVPLEMAKAAPPYLLVRVHGDTRAVAAAIREIVRQADPQMAATIATLASVIEQQGERLKPMTRHGAAAGGLALLLALTGIYGVVSFAVSQRVREIGIRLALGAGRRDVMRLVLRSAAAPICAGLIAGIALVLTVSTAMRAVLFGLNPRDPVILAAVSLALLAAALAATWIPAHRASRLDPLTSLRRE